MTARKLAWLAVAAVMTGAACWYGLAVDRFDHPGWERPVLCTVLGLAGMTAVFLSPSIRGAGSALAYLWLPAVLLRLVLLPAAPSDDVNRYLWEGKLLRAGVSPYAHTADAPDLERYRDRYWEAMNHRDKPTAYPPLAEQAFGAIGAVAYHPLAYKLAFVLADLLVLGAIVALLRRRGMAVAFAGFYAFNPIVLLGFAAEAHFDALMVAPLVWALWAAEAGRPRIGVALGALSAGIKWITLPLLPFLAGKRLYSGGIVALGVLVLPFLFVPGGSFGFFTGLLEFGGTRSFNGPVYELLYLGAGLPRTVCSALVGLAFGGIVLWRWLRRERFAADAHLRWILGALIVLSPTVHFWYLTWILPFVCLRPSLPWLSFSLTGGVYFFVWINASSPSGWGITPAQMGLYWGPFFLACAYELWSTRGRCVFPTGREGEGGRPRAPDRAVASDASISVVIPVLNAADVLPAALDSVAGQSLPVREVVVVDGGSTDASRERAGAHPLPVRWIESDPGRGNQIATGIAAAASDWVLVLHADAVLEPGSVDALGRAVTADPAMTGGSLGQRFTGNAPEVLPIEVLNDIRALLTRTSFGDQVQFFHRETALSRAIMPRQPLMEDVEASWRLRETGGAVFLGQPCRACNRKWTRRGWLRRFALVLRLVSRYRWARLRGTDAAENLSSKLYDEYYAGRN